MAKRRKGVNSRKKYIQRKKKMGARVRKVLPVTLVGLLSIAAVIGIFSSGVISIDKIASMIDTSGFMRVKRIAVTGNQRVSVEDIIKRSGLAENCKLYNVKTSSIAASIGSDPWIEKVRCVKKWWGKVVIEIRERTPVAMIHTGTIYLVDREGVLLPIENGVSYQLPLISGAAVICTKKGVKHVAPAVMHRITRFISTAQSEDTAWFRNITQLDVRDSAVIRCRVASSRTVVDAGYETNKKQLRNLRYLLDVLAQDGNAPAQIDLRYQNLAFVHRGSSAIEGVVND